MGLGKTLQAISALCYVLDKSPSAPTIILAPKSALYQWASEFEKFTVGITPVVVSGDRAKRKKAYAQYFGSKDLVITPRVLIMTYDTLVQDWTQGSEIVITGNKKTLTRGLLDGYTYEIKDLTVIADEASALKNNSSKRWKVVNLLAQRATRFWGMTATILKNNLMEGFCIFKIVHPDLFGTKTNFMDNYCITRRLRMGNREVPIVVGYKNLEGFRAKIDPYFLGRQKHEVSTELPTLITREHTFPLSTAEDLKYKEALEGILELGNGEVKDYSETAALTSLIYAQKVVDSLTLLKYEEGDTILGSGDFEKIDVFSKEAALLDLLTGEYEGCQVVVYTKFESHVARLESLAAKAKIKTSKITGKVKDKDREKAKKDFQEGKVQVIFITDAASEAVNLQQAEAMIFYNSPWSWGQYLQVLGRMIRIGSPHSGVVAVHLVGTRANGKPTIDRHVLKLLSTKKTFIEQVLGVSTKGALDFQSEKSKNGGSDTKELIKEILRDV